MNNDALSTKHDLIKPSIFQGYFLVRLNNYCVLKYRFISTNQHCQFKFKLNIYLINQTRPK